MDIKLPKLGEGADSGTVVNVLVQEGDQVEEGQTILELENEKAVAPIPATASGVVSRIKVKEGDRLSVGQVIMTLSTDGDGGGEEGGQKAEEEPKKKRKSRKSESKKQDTEEDEAEAEREEEESEEEEPETDEEESEEDEEAADAGKLPPAAPPSIRRLARQLGIDLRRVRGTEAGGRISMSDMKAYVQRLQKLAFASRRGGADASGESKPEAESIDFSQWGPVTKKSMSPLRQTISRRMAENWNTVPHVTQFDEADITELNALRKKFAPAYDEKGAKLTLTPFVLKAVAAALRKHPIFNASLDEAAEEIVFKEYYHLGLAVDTEHGLMVPVIRDADKKSLWELSREVNAMAEKARDRKISLEEMKGGTFTISNQGGIGGAHFTPIVNKPEVAILGLGRGALKPVVRGGNIEQRLLLPIGLSYDHRLIDGGTAARFTVDLLEAFQAFKEEEVRL